VTLREKIIHIIDCVEDQDDSVCMDQAADAILAAIREHMTTEEALDRAAAAYWSDGDLVADIGDVLKKAILAALGGEL
jgi:hypothetical protein